MRYPHLHTISLVGKRIKDIDFKRHKLLFIGFQSGKDNKFIFNPASTD